MRRGIAVWVLASFVAAGGLVVASADTIGFGYGGGGVVAFFPDLAGVNAYLSENGLSPLSTEFLIGGGGGGRGGEVGGLVFGGMGFGVVAESEGEDRWAELVVGAGGFDVGWAIGGGDGSVLTLGAVLGGGAAVLDVSFSGVVPMGDGRGVIPVPVETREIGRAFGFVLPYVSMEAQILAFLGLEVRIGYLVPLVGVDFGEGLGIPAPSLDFSGPVVGVSLVFGGIGSSGGEKETSKTQISRGSVDLGSAADVSIESGMGTVLVTSYEVAATQSASGRIVEWEAARHAARPRDLDGLRVDVAQTAGGVELRSAGKGQIDYVVRVPAGTNVGVVAGAGRVEFAQCTAEAVSVSIGAGEIVLTNLNAKTLTVSSGTGVAYILYPRVTSLSADVGMGEIQLVLLPTTSATIAASVGVGELTLAGFPEVVAAPRGTLGRTLEAVMGAGEARITLSVGIGKIGIGPTP